MTQHLFANDGTDWTTPPSPVDATKARKADEKVDKAALAGEGPTGTNDVKLAHTIVEGSASKQ